MKISVVMAVYNGELYLREQLLSIIHQSVKPDEIVISDDNSTDQSIKILENISKDTNIPIKILYNSDRIGYAKNFRRALGCATGDIIFLSDQDDIWNKRKIEICKRVLFKHKEIMALFTGFYVMEKKSYFKDTIEYSPQKELKIKKINLHKFIQHPAYPGMAMVFRKNILDEIQKQNIYTNNDKIAHDWAINFMGCVMEGMFELDTKLTFYRQHNNNTLGSLRRLVRKEKKRQREKMIESLLDNVLTINLNANCVKKYNKKIKRSIEFQKKRLKLYQQSKYSSLFWHEVWNIEYISFQSILGDIYSIL